MRKYLMGEPGDSLVWFIIVHWILGAVAGALCASIVLILNLGQLRTLLASSDVQVIGLALLYGGFMLTFAAVVCGTALMQLAAKDSA
jgi:hypothetical protein